MQVRPKKNSTGHSPIRQIDIHARGEVVFQRAERNSGSHIIDLESLEAERATGHVEVAAHSSGQSAHQREFHTHIGTEIRGNPFQRNIHSANGDFVGDLARSQTTAEIVGIELPDEEVGLKAQVIGDFPFEFAIHAEFRERVAVDECIAGETASPDQVTHGAKDLLVDLLVDFVDGFF